MQASVSSAGEAAEGVFQNRGIKGPDQDSCSGSSVRRGETDASEDIEFPEHSSGRSQILLEALIRRVQASRVKTPSSDAESSPLLFLRILPPSRTDSRTAAGVFSRLLILHSLGKVELRQRAVSLCRLGEEDVGRFPGSYESVGFPPLELFIPSTDQDSRHSGEEAAFFKVPVTLRPEREVR